MANDDLIAYVALTQVPGVGAVTAKHLLAWFSEPKQIFTASSAHLRQVAGVGSIMAKAIHASKPLLEDAKYIIEQCQKKKIKILTLADEQYPRRLKEIPDAPTVLYRTGHGPPDLLRMVSIVGTRKNSAYGDRTTRQIVSQLAELQIGVVSGLAFGIDTIAHKAALERGLVTYAVLATPVDQVYPAQNRALAIDIYHKGCIFSEYPPGSKVDARNFPMRNRIIAGMADATIVVEAGESGGALITATLAQDYDRQVFAVPGRITDQASAGCNQLIAKNQAAIFASVEYFLAEMNWDAPGISKPRASPATLPTHLTAIEVQLMQILSNATGVHIDDASFATSIPLNILAGMLLKLEFEGLVVSLPGKKYRTSDPYLSV